MIKNVFSNRVIIIDEAHNTNPNSELMIKKNKEQKSLKMFPECIKTILRYSENTKLPDRYVIKPKLAIAIIIGTIANPSNPSVKLTAFDVPTITKLVKQ